MSIQKIFFHIVKLCNTFSLLKWKIDACRIRVLTLTINHTRTCPFFKYFLLDVINQIIYIFYIPLNLFKVIISFSKIEHNVVWFACLKNKSLQSLKKNWHSCQKPSKILKFVLKSLQKKLCYIEEQLQEIQICKKPNYKYQAHTHASHHNGWWGYKLFNVFLILN